VMKIPQINESDYGVGVLEMFYIHFFFIKILEGVIRHWKEDFRRYGCGYAPLPNLGSHKSNQEAKRMAF
jgi:hypothetical protein